ncbi:TetR/AcrR family transcriptional regulator [Dactylosporangium sp. CA-139066]|uniref:TetR/AcrR family transcriptional regulator n=1 Tax=Dactylosporangium sp. CA-139066 TaxID=3239930 RepID=UPI003D8C90B6
MSTRRRSTGSPTGLARKEVIVRAAAKVFAEKGFSNATVRDIADEADMLSGSLYYYFDSKEAMVEEVLAGYLDVTVRGYQRAADELEDPVEALRELISLALHGLVQYRAEVTILQNDWHNIRPIESIGRRQRDVEKIWLSTLERGIAANVFRSDLDVRMVYRTLMGAIQAVIRWFDPRGKVSVDDVIEVQSSILLDGIRNSR